MRKNDRSPSLRSSCYWQPLLSAQSELLLLLTESSPESLPVVHVVCAAVFASRRLNLTVLYLGTAALVSTPHLGVLYSYPEYFLNLALLETSGPFTFNLWPGSFPSAADCPPLR